MIGDKNIRYTPATASAAISVGSLAWPWNLIQSELTGGDGFVHKDGAAALGWANSAMQALTPVCTVADDWVFSCIVEDLGANNIAKIGLRNATQTHYLYPGYGTFYVSDPAGDHAHGTYSVGSLLQVKLIGTVITYWVDGVLRHTSAYTRTTDLWIQGSIYRDMGFNTITIEQI